MNRYYILDGETPIPLSDYEWEEWRGVRRHIIRNTDLLGGEVSTIFLGINHNYAEPSDPILFETMVFGGDLDGTQERYRTYEEAIAGHAEMIEKVERVRVID